MLAALLLTLSYISWQAQAAPVLLLGLAPDSFDDAYVGCMEEMEEKAAVLLQEEMGHHGLLRESWEAAHEAWERRREGLTLPPGFRAQHGIAVMVYTNSSNTLYLELNQAVRTGGSSRELYLRSFPFKALHFYLTRALQLLRSKEGCSGGPGEVVFRGVGTLRFEPKTLGDAVRMGHFASSSLDEAVARRFSNATLFSLRTCFGAPIQALSVFPEEREVLIPPNEIFLVTSFSQEGAQSLVTLQSYNQTCSHFNCAYLGGEKRRDCVSAPGPPSKADLALSFQKILHMSPKVFSCHELGPESVVHRAGHLSDWTVFTDEGTLQMAWRGRHVLRIPIIGGI